MQLLRGNRRRVWGSCLGGQQRLDGPGGLCEEFLQLVWVQTWSLATVVYRVLRSLSFE